MRRNRTRRTAAFRTLALLFCASPVGFVLRDAAAGESTPSVIAVSPDTSYVPYDGVLAGDVTVDVPLAGEYELALIAHRETAVPAGGDAGSSREVVLRRTIDRKGRSAVPFFVNPRTMLFGGLRLEAELRRAASGAVEAGAWSEPVSVGVRTRLDLSGEWSVENVTSFAYGVGNAKKAYLPAAPPRKIELPGRFERTSLTSEFRGWVSVNRQVAVGTDTELRPRFLCISGASDGVRAEAGGKLLGEIASEEDIDWSLSHWTYFHGFRTNPNLPENEEGRRAIRLLSLHEPHAPVSWPLPNDVASKSVVPIGLTIRGISGCAYAPKPPYGILGDLHLELAPAVHIRAVSFDTARPNEQTRFTFALEVANTGRRAFSGSLQVVYGEYEGESPYTGSYPAFDRAVQELSIRPGTTTVRVLRDEAPRFATCRATFVIRDRNGAVLDAQGMDYHTVSVEIRDRRDMYVNNERFIMKGRGSHDGTHVERWQMLVNGCNARRGMGSRPARAQRELTSTADWVDDRLAEGILHDTGPLLASCEKCAFWDPENPSNIERAVRHHVLRRQLYRCPGIIQWEATNELFGETEELRVAIGRLFRELDPYHRPVLMTKSSGEWESEARGGRVEGPDIIGVQYLNTRGATDSITATITEQPIQSTEINWNDGNMIRDGLWEYWLDKGVCGALLFDYSGHSLKQGTPLIPPGDREKDGEVIHDSHRAMYQDVTATARSTGSGAVRLILGNRMPYTLRNVTIQIEDTGSFEIPRLDPGDAAQLELPGGAAKSRQGFGEYVPVFARYDTHGGLPHAAVLTPRVEAMAKGGAQ